MGLIVVMVILVTGIARAADERCTNPGSLTDVTLINECISSYSKTAEAIEKANTHNKQELQGLLAQVARLKAQLVALDKQLVKLGDELFAREVQMGVRKELLYERVRNDYIRGREQPMLMLLFANQSATTLLKNLSYRERVVNRDQLIISEVGREISDISKQTAALKSQKASLAVLQEKVNKQADFLAAEVSKADQYVADLSSKVAALSARQQEILAERSGSFVVDIGDSELADDYNASIKGFRESAPAGSYAVFSFGAYTHRKGMSQYGARGRVASGQNYRQVLKAYYGKEPTKVETGGSIKVSG